MIPYVTVETLSHKAGQWLEQIATFNSHKMSLRTEKAALLVIDMQDFFLNPDSPTYVDGGPAIIHKIVEIINVFRRAKRPVIFTRHVHHPDGLDAGIMGWWWEGMCIEGSPESEIHRDLRPLPREKVILKRRYSAFFNTDLEIVLRCLNAEDLVVSGIMTNMCCESTARDAYYRDLRVFFLADGTASINEQMHLASLLNLAFGFAFITTANDIISQINQ
jgi:nicotinamidase-related amidase